MSFSAEQCVIITSFLLSIVSYSFYMFDDFAEDLILTGKSDAFKKLICIVERVHFHVRIGVKNLTKYFSPSFVLRYVATVFANAIWLLTSCSCVSST